MLFWLLFTVFLKSRGMTDNLKHNKNSLMCTFESLVGEEVAKGIQLEIEMIWKDDYCWLTYTIISDRVV
jgi:hypothetical protein